MKTLRKIFLHPWLLIQSITYLLGPFIPDKTYLTLLYKCKMGKWINWKNPRLFTEKIQWLKIYNRKAEYSILVDKYAVKEYIAKKIGNKYVIPNLGIWDDVEKITFNNLPNQFVLKTTHGGGSGGIVICNDKNKFDIEKAKRKLKISLNTSIFKRYREWPYKSIQRRIIAEEKLQSKFSHDIKDYKFFCFNGRPQFLKVDYDRHVDHHANYYDMEWRLLPFGEADFPPKKSHIELCPNNFNEMIEIAKKLSEGHKFLRVDLYNVDGKVYFGELTFFPASGLGKFIPDDWDEKIGALLCLDMENGK